MDLLSGVVRAEGESIEVSIVLQLFGVDSNGSGCCICWAVPFCLAGEEVAILIINELFALAVAAGAFDLVIIFGVLVFFTIPNWDACGTSVVYKANYRWGIYILENLEKYV